MNRVTYEIECDACESVCEIEIDDIEWEAPAYCPFCGSPVTVEDIEEDV